MSASGHPNPRRQPALRVRLALVLIVAASLAAKLVIFALVYAGDPERVLGNDSLGYENPARALLATGRYATGPDEPSTPETLRTPGYPLFIAGLFAIFGEHRSAVVLAQVGLSALTLILTFLLGRRLWDERIALVGVVWLAVDLVSFVYAQLLFTETLFTCLMTAAGLAGLVLLSTGSLGSGLAFGAALAGATLVRPIAYYLLLPSLGGLAIFALRTGWPAKRIAIVVLAAAVPWLCSVEAWRVRNYVATGSWEFSRIRSVNLLFYRGAGIVAERDGISFEEARRRVEAGLPETTGWPVAQVDALHAAEGVRLIRAHPGLFVRAQLFGLTKIVMGPGRSDILHYFRGDPYEEAPAGTVRLSMDDLRARWRPGDSLTLGLLSYSAAYLVALYCALAIGVFHVVRYERAQLAPHVLLWGVAVYLLVIAAGPEAYARFRVPVMPFLALYAGRGVAAILSRSGQRPKIVTS